MTGQGGCCGKPRQTRDAGSEPPAPLAQEKEFTRQRDALNAERRKLPMVEIDKGYIFHGADGQASLLDLFKGRGQLLVYHFMFDPEWHEGCESCSFLADGIGHAAHLHARDTTLAMISRAPLPKLEAFRQRMGWTVPWYSCFGSDFNYDFHVTLDPAVAPVEYNYRDLDELGPDWQGWTGELHGISAFLRRGDRVFHTYSSYARGTDIASLPSRPTVDGAVTPLPECLPPHRPHLLSGQRNVLSQGLPRGPRHAARRGRPCSTGFAVSERATA